MGRLLWKEWHEVRWYLLGLICLPWVMTLFPNWNFGYKANEGSNVMALFLMLLILGFWAATRVSGECSGNNSLTTRSLAINPGMIWGVKFLPGLLAAIAMPIFIQFACLVRFYLTVDVLPSMSVFGVSVPVVFMDNLMISIALYSIVFLLSMMASTMVAIIIGFVTVFMVCPFVLEHINPYMTSGFSQKNLFYALLTTIACSGSIGLSIRNPSERLALKLRTMGLSFTYGLVTLFVISSIGWMVTVGSPYGLFYEIDYLKSVASIRHQDSECHWYIPEPLSDSSGRRIAYK